MSSKNKVLAISLSEEFLNELKELASNSGLSASSYARMVLFQYMNELNTESITDSTDSEVA